MARLMGLMAPDAPCGPVIQRIVEPGRAVRPPARQEPSIGPIADRD